MPRLLLITLSMTMLGCPAVEEENEAPAPPSRVKAPEELFEKNKLEPEINPQASLVCGKGSRDAFSEIYPPNIIDVADSYYFEDLGGELTRLETVMFDKYSMAVFVQVVREHGDLKSTDTVMDVGSGTGALGLAALAHGAGRVVATELDPLAIRNTRMNAIALGVSDRVETRLVTYEDQGAYAVIQEDERFDLILADPPQGYDFFVRRPFPEVDEDTPHPKEVYFSQDPGACFLNSLLEDLDKHLSPKGRLFLALKSDRAKNLLPGLARRYGLTFRTIYDAQKDDTHQNARRIGSRNNVPDMSSAMVMFELRPKDQDAR